MDYPKMLLSLKEILKPKTHTDAKTELFTQAVSCNPSSMQDYNDVGKELWKVGDMEGAMEAFKRAASLNNEAVMPLCNIGNIYSATGNLESARKYYEKALVIQPHAPGILRNLSLTTKCQPGDPLFKRLQQAFIKNQGDLDSQMHLHFALGKAHDDIKEHDVAFEHFKHANEIGLKLSNYSAEAHDHLFKTVQRCFSEEVAPLLNPSAIKSTPIFILGMPRSGTSLVEQILASHCDVFGSGELAYLTRAIMPKLRKMKQASAPDQELLSHVRNKYFQQLHNETSKPYFTDKMPMNFRWIGFILKAIPEAKIIHIKRDPMAICWSIYRRLLPSKGLDYQWSQEALATYYLQYQEIMAFWHQCYPNCIIDIEYEALTENQEEQTRALLDACDLSWDSKCLDFQNTKRAVRTASAIQIRQGMYQSSSQAWKNYKEYLKPMQKTLGLHDC